MFYLRKTPILGTLFKAKIQTVLGKVLLDSSWNEMSQTINFMKLQPNHSQTMKNRGEKKGPEITKTTLTLQKHN